MLHPPFDAIGKALMSTVICEELVPASTLVGAGGYKGKAAKITPSVGLSLNPPALNALTLILKTFPT